MNEGFDDKSNNNLAFFVRKAMEGSANIDKLTGIANGPYFKVGLTNLVERLKGGDRRPADSKPAFKAVLVLRFDLKNLKAKNLGGNKKEGDPYLISFANLLKKIARRQDDIVARDGGDEFSAAFSIEGTSQEGINKDVQSILKSTKDVVSEFAYMGYSIGEKGGVLSADELLLQADNMMVKNKTNEKTKVATPA